MRLTRHSLFAIAIAMLPACASTTDTSSGDDSSGSAGTSTSTDSDTNAGTVATVATGYTADCENFEQDSDYSWDAGSEIAITLSDGGTETGGEGVTIVGSQVTITSAGTYRIGGTLSDGRIVVDTTDSAPVRLILDNASVHSTLNAALHVLNADKTVIVLAAGTTNTLSDTANYDSTTEANAALFSQSNLSVSGDGTLVVTGNYNDGITGKDGLVVRSGNLVVNSVDDGIRGKDCLVVNGGTMKVTAGGDGLKSDNADGGDLGYVSIKEGSFDIASTGDGIAAEGALYVSGGSITLTTGGGSGQVVATDSSSKGLKSELGIAMDAGTLTVDAADDAVHSASSIWLNGGSLTLGSGDDGIHSDALVVLNGTEISITKSVEGIEGPQITVNSGTTHVTASDDGLNASDGSGTSTTEPTTASTTTTTTASSLLLNIKGGLLVVNASGDGLDSNGNLTMSGGTVLVSGPTDNGNGSLDIGDGAGFSLTITGGMLVATGSAGMAVTPSSTSTQGAVLVTNQSTGMGRTQTGSASSTASAFAAGTWVDITNTEGTTLLAFAPPKSYASLVFSSPELTAGSYTVSTGGTCSGTVTDYRCIDDTFSAGTARATFSHSTDSTVSTVLWSVE